MTKKRRRKDKENWLKIGAKTIIDPVKKSKAVQVGVKIVDKGRREFVKGFRKI